ncbi:MAG: Tyrosine recombinase XerD [Syntrophorhabdus sp. PtaU1.Bin002]|nr:MAG: Tyrosine recombinase XerD [Syntrophorhabdus sp. PtaU1.Bin002]OPY73983.1 MAG: Tyrosine recombinase XerD [Syntrophorhabdus sp. PtaU1.Bin002]
MQNLIEKYHTHLIARNYAKRTIEGLFFYLNRFVAWLMERDITDISGVTREMVRDYQVHLIEEVNHKGQPNTVCHQNRKLQAVKSFLQFLAENDYLVSDPSRGVAYAREPKRLPRSILTPSEMRKLLHAPDVRTILGYRDRTILEVLYSSGIRKEEVLNLLLTDVDYHDGFLRINGGKGNKDRVVPIGRIACRYLENYIKAVRPSLIRDPYNNHLFLSLRGKRLSKNMVWEIVKSYTRKAKIKKTVSPHTFRHTCATVMLRNNANIRHIQELLGHASLDSTQVYARVSIADLKEVHSRCHPREKDRD